MAIRIEDGRGNGNIAAVDSNKRLEVSSIHKSLITDATESGEAYVVYGKHTLQSTNDEDLMLLTNSSTDKHIHISFLFLSATGTAVKFEGFFDSTRTSGGAVIVPLNSNRTSGKQSAAVVYHSPSNDLVLSNDNTKEFFDIRLSSNGLPTFEFRPDGAILLGPGDSMGIQIKGAIGDEVRCTVSFYEEETSL